ncbi:MAG: Holliday junction branch migration protein RuvA [Alkalilacustris sp.]
MIGWISGRLLHRGADHVLIDVGGVGYVVLVSDRVLAGLPPPGSAVALHTEMVVREDLLQLIGFPTLIEKEWHRLLTTVQGVGVRASMALIGALGPEALARAIALGDWSALRAAPGVGPKLAQRIANELKAKAPALMAMAGTLPEPVAPTATASGPASPGIQAAPPPATPVHAAAAASAEALSALINLGYGQGEAAGAVAEAAREAPDAATPALIRAALRRLAPNA